MLCCLIMMHACYKALSMRVIRVRQQQGVVPASSAQVQGNIMLKNDVRFSA